MKSNRLTFWVSVTLAESILLSLLLIGLIAILIIAIKAYKRENRDNYDWLLEKEAGLK